MTLREFDDNETSRRVMAEAVAASRGQALEEIKKGLKIKGRVNSTKVGWMMAFSQYPFSLKVETKDIPLIFVDVVQGVTSLGEDVTMQDEVLWKQYDTQRWHGVTLVLAREMIEKADELYPHAIQSHHENVQEMVDAAVLQRVIAGLETMINTMPEKTMADLILGGLLEISVEGLEETAAVTKRMMMEIEPEDKYSTNTLRAALKRYVRDKAIAGAWLPSTTVRVVLGGTEEVS